jgi:hypothetical protein
MVRKPCRIVVGIGLMFGLWNGACVEAASPVEDSAQLFNNFDRDGSGAISQTELGGFTAFARYDQNGDGELSQAEFVGGRTADRRAAAAGGATEASWKLLDWNNDGFLSGTELDGRWEVFDADANGRVYKQEFLAANPNPVPQPGGVDPPVGADKSLSGRKLAEARNEDFFQFFRLAPLPGTVVLEAGTRHDFRPSGPAFRNLVLVQILVDDEQRIKGVDVLVNRSFIDEAKTAPFARDLVKSVLRDFVPAADRARIQPLINEVEFGNANRVQIAGSAPPQLPNPPTAGYQTFLGRQEQFEQKLGTVQLVLWNGNEEGDDKLLRISIQLKTDDEERS